MALDYYTAIGSFGFPIVACVYMALKFEKSINENTKAIRTLYSLLSKKLSKK